MTRASRVVFTRPKWRYRDAIRSYRLYIDDVPCGKIKAGGELTIDLHPGRHIAEARIDWSGSPRLRFTAQEGQTTRIQAAPAGNALKFWQAFTHAGYVELTLL
ncbi:hypothetical protein J4573_41445 [Actinomadura barringtoniae]|uniref:Uncharacterized protein n=1 Tax=Actinomadura barringtoniae TaxID=1427535 RepID=A0A939PPA3_9ACTN|nr:hypothetical protein [Actinomadura barringtoniae]MBO2453614.1 hypothetical protein [Actinomadura barringtoniae]